MFRDMPKTVTFRLRPMFDLRTARDAHRYNRAVETRRVVPRHSTPVPRLDDPAYLAPYADIDQGKAELFV